MALVFRMEARLAAQQGLLQPRHAMLGVHVLRVPLRNFSCTHAQKQIYTRQIQATKPARQIQMHTQRQCVFTPTRRYMQTETHTGAQADAHSTTAKRGIFSRFFRSLKWAPIPVTLGVMVMAVEDYRHAHKREVAAVQGKTAEELVLDPWAVTLIRKLPTRILSRLFGDLMSLPCPLWLRRPVYGLYAKVFGCNLDEMAAEDLVMFESMQDFFTRELKPGVREIDESALLVSPADARVLHFGPVKDGRVEQIKGLTYSVRGLIGPDLAVTAPNADAEKKDTVVQHIILYLAPGDYHRFHSPTEWTVDTRRYFPGDLLSVSPVAARLIKGLFNYNERVVLSGQWKHGFFSYIPVGAYNVGSIVLNMDPTLVTNQRGVEYTEGEYREREWDNGVKVGKGDEMGMFRLGSTIVLVFEAPNDFHFTVQPGDRVLMGQKLGVLLSEGPADGA